MSCLFGQPYLQLFLGLPATLALNHSCLEVTLCLVYPLHQALLHLLQLGHVVFLCLSQPTLTGCKAVLKLLVLGGEKGGRREGGGRRGRKERGETMPST